MDTPSRVARSYREIFEGLETANDKIHEILGQSFPTKYDGIVQETGITVFSMCPHHFLPIRYEVSIGYVPDEKALGLSKLARIVELVAKLPSLQETFTERIVDEIDASGSPRCYSHSTSHLSVSKQGLTAGSGREERQRRQRERHTQRGIFERN